MDSDVPKASAAQTCDCVVAVIVLVIEPPRSGTALFVDSVALIVVYGSVDVGSRDRKGTQTGYGVSSAQVDRGRCIQRRDDFDLANARGEGYVAYII